MKSHRYRVTLEHLAGKSPEDVLHAPLQFECTNHDDIFSIIERAQAAQLFAGDDSSGDSNAAFVVGLKLFSEIMLSHRDDPLFTPLQGAFGEFMKGLKARTKLTP